MSCGPTQTPREARPVASGAGRLATRLLALLLVLPACPAEDTDSPRPGVAVPDASLRDLGGRPDGGSADSGPSDMDSDPLEDGTLADLADAASDSPTDSTPDDTGSPDLPAPDTDAADLSADDGGGDAECVSENRCSPSGPASFCDGTVLIVCIPDADGCLIESAQDCASDARTCEESGATAACVGSAGSGDGDTCSDAIVLEPGSYSFNSTGFSDDYEEYYGACGGDIGWGPEIVFSVTVPAGDLLEVTIMGEGFDMIAAIATACPDVSGSCVDYSDVSITFEPEVVSVTNTGAASRSYFVVADGWSSNDYGRFDITVEVR